MLGSYILPPPVDVRYDTLPTRADGCNFPLSLMDPIAMVKIFTRTSVLSSIYSESILIMTGVFVISAGTIWNPSSWFDIYCNNCTNCTLTPWFHMNTCWLNVDSSNFVTRYYLKIYNSLVKKINLLDTVMSSLELENHVIDNCILAITSHVKFK